MWFKRKRDPSCDCGKIMVWAVITYGTSIDTGEPTRNVYGPFYDKLAALDLKDYWENKFQGVAVVDYRYINEPLADLGEV